jgi:hypothetical protein
MNRISLGLGLVLVVVAGVWVAVISPRYQMRFPDGWSWRFDAEGYTVYPSGSDFPPPPYNNDLNIRSITIESENADGSITFYDRYQTFDPATNAQLWDLEYRTTVDPISGRLLAPYENDYFFLPRNPDKTTYTIRNSAYESIPMTFVEEVQVEGVNTYLYQFKGTWNNTILYPDYELGEGQTILCFDFELSYWIEPNTGDPVKLLEDCPGDWVVNQTTETKILPISKWRTETSTTDPVRQVESIIARLNQERLLSVFVPLGLGIFGMVLMVWFFVAQRRTA